MIWRIMSQFFSAFPPVQAYALSLDIVCLYAVPSYLNNLRIIYKNEI